MQLHHFLTQDEVRYGYILSMEYTGLATDSSQLHGPVRDILRHAGNLQSLAVAFTSPKPLSDYIMQNMASVRSLRSFAFAGSITMAELRNLVTNIHSPLEALQLRALVRGDDDVPDWNQRLDQVITMDYNPIPLLANFQSTLKQLSLSHVALSATQEQYTFPRMERLIIWRCTDIDLNFLVPTFPNLQCIVLQSRIGFPAAYNRFLMGQGGQELSKILEGDGHDKISNRQHQCETIRKNRNITIILFKSTTGA